MSLKKTNVRRERSYTPMHLDGNHRCANRFDGDCAVGEMIGKTLFWLEYFGS